LNRTIEVLISPQGETTVQTKGFAGNRCREASRFIEQALGTRASEQLTAEFYQPASQPQSQEHQA
jgi:hypothetical protein